MKSWFLVYYNGDMDRCTEHFDMLVPDNTSPTKSMIQNHLGIDIGNNWSVEPVRR